ncbi:MAG: hypothetical protein EOR85_31085 [Mesorhizobium sp.]|uniref:CCE_0567 family metalloprotein n=1 Tax=Mesorhizobium sp. TaxID=1871066 RepID=UPI000FE90EBF|nr:CCE_0567 family metalloprotein [Mesorhizobium sp.]RWM51765.1 MAG: hypothetical protein EOR79_28080 [Mesorhizobium sp.]RWM90229.1 MAG: hypothetical protein EOR85_31085 [Mesorhizobium sp.]TIN41933.1 MAG: hypothetical protein E5Y32_21495 [Mesorhizobium sp.]
MSDLEMRKKVRKLQLRSAIAKMALHELVDDLPVKWTEIQEVAEKTHALYAELDAAKRELSTMKNVR